MKTFEEAVKRISEKAWTYDFEQKVEQLRKEGHNDETENPILSEATLCEH